jgi:outer membrane protein assembly factor BamB
MQFVKSKTAATTMALFLALTIAATIVALPTANAHTPAWNIPTYAYISVTPNPVGVNQEVSVIMWLDKPPPTANGAYGDRWQDYTVNVVKPGGSNDTLGPFTSDPVGSGYTSYTPTETGNYTFQFIYPGQKLAGANPNPSPTDTYKLSPFVNDTYEASMSDPVTLIVQQEQIQPYPNTPLPTSYWTRPIYAENRLWYSVASDWLAGNSIFNRIQPYGTAPNTAHIMWTKPITFGGIVDGQFADVPYYEGFTYESYWNPPLIIDGRLYYNTPTPPIYGFKCVDLRTGEDIWYQNGTDGQQIQGTSNKYPQLSFGQLLNYDSPNQHGVIPAYLWSTAGSTWNMYDAWTGNYICSISGVPSGTGVNAPDGSILRYQLNLLGRWLALWNSTQCLQNTFPSTAIANGYWEWRPPTGQAVPASLGYVWNVTNISPDIPTTATSFTGIDPTYQILLLSTDMNFLAQASYPTPNYYTQCAISLKPGQEGRLLWIQNRTWPSGNLTLWMGPVGDNFYAVYVKETRQWYGYNLTTGEYMWGPTPSQTVWDLYGPNSGIPFAAVAYGKLFASDYDGDLYAYDIQTGKLLWTYSSGSGGFEIPYPQYPLFIGAIADGKIYLYDGEHSPTKPQWRGSALRCIYLDNGTELWKIDDWAGNVAGGGGTISIADGYLVNLNSYDNQIYCFGKGPSATTVAASPKVSVHGDSVLIEGMVTDVSAGAKQKVQDGEFSVVPAISDASMTDWMKFIYMQQPCPTNATGVEVSLDTLDPNGNFIHIATVTSDSSGMFKKMWTPEVPGEYTIIASFMGTESYGSSYAETSIGVSEAPSTTPPTQPTTPESPMLTYVLAAVIALIIIVLAIGILLLRRK